MPTIVLPQLEDETTKVLYDVDGDVERLDVYEDITLTVLISRYDLTYNPTKDVTQIVRQDYEGATVVRTVTETITYLPSGDADIVDVVET